MRSTPWALLLRATFLGLIAALPPLFSAWVDPAKLLDAHTSEPRIARALTAGHHVTDVMNYDDRRIVREMARLLSRPPELLAVGSSRMQALPGAAFPRCGFLNAAVSDGRINDFLGLYGVFDEPARRPRQLVLGLDPWSFIDVEQSRPWASLVGERARVLTKLGVSHSAMRDELRLRTETFKVLASPQYFRLALFSLRHHGSSGIQYRVTDQPQNREKTKAPDGHIIWPVISEAQADSIATDFVRLVRQGAAPYDGREHPDSGALALLRQFLQYATRSNVNVLVVLPPFHPAVYDEFLKQPASAIVMAEQRYRDIAGGVGVPVVGSYDPRRAGVRASDFFDQSHMRPAPLAKLVSAGATKPGCLTS